MPKYKRILLKLSGEALMGDDAYGINRATMVRMVNEIRIVSRLPATIVTTLLQNLIDLFKSIRIDFTLNCFQEIRSPLTKLVFREFCQFLCGFIKFRL